MIHPSRTSGKLLAVLVLAGLGSPLTAIAASSGSGSSTGGTEYGAPLGEVGSIELRARPQALLGGTMVFHGTAAPGATVVVQRRSGAASAWITSATATADASGDYVARWRTDHIGVFTVRALGGEGSSARAASAAPSITVTVFKPALATWYGPGFYGKRTACGQRLSRSLLGVAHRGLPCGRRVALLYKGRTIVVPVVDRGPFAHGADWDLTEAAARRLGLERTDTIGAVSLPADGAR